MNRILQQVLIGDLPPGFRVVEVVELPDVRGGDPTAVPKPPEIMGGHFWGSAEDRWAGRTPASSSSGPFL